MSQPGIQGQPRVQRDQRDGGVQGGAAGEAGEEAGDVSSVRAGAGSLPSPRHLVPLPLPPLSSPGPPLLRPTPLLGPHGPVHQWSLRQVRPREDPE